MTINFDHIFQWQLLKGSHKFPGPDGGTCINEAAIVAAGFEYKTVNSSSDCPPCFSRLIAQYAINLNDKMPDDIRQELLMPFVMKLSGTADERNVEVARCHYIAMQTVKRILPIILKARGFNKEADLCASVTDIYQAREAAKTARKATAAAYADDAAAYDAAYAAACADDAAAAYADDAYAAAAAYAAAYAADAYAAAAYAAAAAAYDAAAAAAYAAACAADAYDKKLIWKIATEILDESIKLGRHTVIETPLAFERLEKIKKQKDGKRKAASPTPPTEEN